MISVAVNWLWDHRCGRNTRSLLTNSCQLVRGFVTLVGIVVRTVVVRRRIIAGIIFFYSIPTNVLYPQTHQLGTGFGMT